VLGSAGDGGGGECLGALGPDVGHEPAPEEVLQLTQARGILLVVADVELRTQMARDDVGRVGPELG
jgi:hypothetical protein